MQAPIPLSERVLAALRQRMLALLCTAYVLAAWAPGPGLALRSLSMGTLSVAGATLTISLPLLLLALLLFNVTATMPLRLLAQVAKQKRLLWGALLLTTALGHAFTVASMGALSWWPDGDEQQQVILGLTLISAMPIAGASVAWAHNGGGNIALSLALVLASTLLSPLVAPLVLHGFAHGVDGDYAEDLVELAGASTHVVLIAAVGLPSLAGLLAHRLLGPTRVARLHTGLKLANIAVLLLLNYVNAAAVLPRVLHEGDADFLVLVTALAAGRCLVAFGGGACVGRLLRAGRRETVSLIFASGMSNNGSALVLAATSLADHTGALVVIVAYNLAQQIAAGIGDRWLIRRRLADGDGKTDRA